MSSRPKRSTVAATIESSAAGIAHVARLRDRARDPEVVTAPRREAQPDALRVERPRGRRPDPATRPGHQRDPAGKVFHGSLLSLDDRAGDLDP